MTFEEKKSYLRKAYKIDQQIESHTRELEILRMTIGSIGTNYGGVGGGGNKTEAPDVKKMGYAIDLENLIKQEIYEMTQRWKTIHQLIEAISDTDERLVIRYRYIEGNSWDIIASKMSYSRSRIFELHDKGINHIRVD